MTEYLPDKWLVLKINSDDPHYRVFGTWSGGYLDWDRWRMNSGIVRAEDDGDFINFYGASGSCYRCHKGMYGSTAYGYSIIDGRVNQKVYTILPEDTDWFEQDWIIK